MDYPSRRKIGERGSLATKMLQLLGISRALVRSLDTSEEEGIRMDIPLDYNHSKQIEPALLKIEHNKAKALMEVQRQRMRML